jgi:hypothetical protein
VAGTRPVAPGPPDDDLPDHDQATMSRLFSRPIPDWSDREGGGGVRRRRRGDSRRRPRRQRRSDRARDPRARLLVLEEAATAIPDAAAGEVAEAMLALG